MDGSLISIGSLWSQKRFWRSAQSQAQTVSRPTQDSSALRNYKNSRCFSTRVQPKAVSKTGISIEKKTSRSNLFLKAQSRENVIADPIPHFKALIWFKQKLTVILIADPGDHLAHISASSSISLALHYTAIAFSDNGLPRKIVRKSSGQNVNRKVWNYRLSLGEFVQCTIL